MKTLRKNNKEMPQIRNTVTEMQNAFDESINRLDTGKVRISELEEMSIEISKIKLLREKRRKDKTDYPNTIGQLQKM